jgi:hypothetical protein
MRSPHCSSSRVLASAPLLTSVLCPCASVLQEKGSVVLTMRVKYSTRKNDRFVSTGFMDERLLGDSRFFPDLSDAWEEDPLHRKTLVCTVCGPSVRALYFCTADASTCHYGLCYKCLDERRNPQSSHTNWPVSDRLRPVCLLRPSWTESGPSRSLVRDGAVHSIPRAWSR